MECQSQPGLADRRSEQVLAAEITYPNFKGAVRDAAHHDAYMDVWSIMCALDDRR